MSCIIHNNILDINFMYISYLYIKINNKIIIPNNILKFKNTCCSIAEGGIHLKGIRAAHLPYTPSSFF